MLLGQNASLHSGIQHKCGATGHHKRFKTTFYGYLLKSDIRRHVVKLLFINTILLCGILNIFVLYNFVFL